MIIAWLFRVHSVTCWDQEQFCSEGFQIFFYSSQFQGINHNWSEGMGPMGGHLGADFKWVLEDNYPTSLKDALGQGWRPTSCKLRFCPCRSTICECQVLKSCLGILDKSYLNCLNMASMFGCLVLIGKDTELDAVDYQFEPYLTARCVFMLV